LRQNRGRRGRNPAPVSSGNLGKGKKRGKGEKKSVCGHKLEKEEGEKRVGSIRPTGKGKSKPADGGPRERKKEARGQKAA